MDVLDELKPSMLVLYDMLSVMESIQVWQQRGASRSPAGSRQGSVCANKCVCDECVCVQDTHAHMIYVFNHACPTSSLSVANMGKAYGV